MKIQAYAAQGPGQRLEPFEYEAGEIAPGEVEIAISHCGICHSDLHLLDNDWGFSRYPMVPGHEIAGTVTKLGAGVKGLKEGLRVGVGWESGSCGHCEYCRRGEENVCLEWRGTCTHGYGGYATAIRVDSRFAIPLPESLPGEAAGPLMCGGVTVYAPLSQETRHSMRVGVIGLGGLGHMAVLFAHAMGCEVTVFSTSPGKEAEARSLGAHGFVRTGDAAAMQRAANSFDFIISTAPADIDWGFYLNALRPKGKLCVVGVPQSEVRVPAFSLIAGRKSIFGSPVGSPATLGEMLEFAARKNIRPVVERFPMAEVNTALERMRRNQVRYRPVLEN